MKIKTLVLGPMDNAVYIVEKNGSAILIDPSWDMAEVENNLSGLKLEALFFTHGHFDHMTDVEPFLRAHKIKAFIEEGDVKMSKLPSDVLAPFQGSQNMKLGPFDIEIIHTPGHSAGSVCIKIGNDLFTGDTLFPGACGRVDLPGANPRQMRESLYKLSLLPPETKVYAGHGDEASTIGRERECNHYMQSSVRDMGKK